MDNSCSDHSKKARDKSSNEIEDLLLSLANLGYNKEMGTNEDVQNVNLLPSSSSMDSDDPFSEAYYWKSLQKEKTQKVLDVGTSLGDPETLCKSYAANGPLVSNVGTSFGNREKLCKIIQEFVEEVKKSQAANASGPLENFNLNEEILENLYGNYVPMAMTEVGSNHLIGLLNADKLLTPILSAMINQVFDLMNNEYGHYVFIKLLSKLDMKFKAIIVEKVTSNHQHLIDTSLSEYGSTSVLKLIEVAHKTPLMQKLTEDIARGIFPLLKHEIGKHVVLKCFSILDLDSCEVLFKSLIEHSIELAHHDVGCVSLCDCMDLLKNGHKDRLRDVLLMSPLGPDVIARLGA